MWRQGDERECQAPPQFPTSKVLWSVVGWLVCSYSFSRPVDVAESFKTEPQAASSPPDDLFRAHLRNSQLWCLATSRRSSSTRDRQHRSTLVWSWSSGLPAAYALAITGQKRTQDVLFFFISTRFLPFAASLCRSISARDLHLLDNIFALALIYTRSTAGWGLAPALVPP